MRFLLSRRWLGFLVVVVALAFLALRLGDWQFNRLDERRERNAVTRSNLDAAPVPVSDVFRTTRQVGQDQEWRRVTATGRWDDGHTVVIRYQTRDSQPGVDVVTPLRLEDGTAVIVDRGWIPSKNSGSAKTPTPRPASGEVTVTGYVRVDGTGGSTVVEDGSARAVSATAIGRSLPYPAYRGFVMLTQQTPRPATTLGAPTLPELDDGPHFFYGLQWWFFGVLAIVGFGYLAFDELRRRREETVESDQAGDQAGVASSTS